MPTYEFRCPAGHDFEKFYRKISDASAELPCPECGAIAQRRVSAGAGLLFKGSGFYITDYGKDGKGARKAGETSGDGKGAKESAGAADKSGASDAKPAKTESAKGGGESGGAKSSGTTDKPSGGSSGSGGSGSAGGAA